jgi:Na+-transporting methylmalonyl-CoA/oxaloacetate decarboxylase beta subunit
MDIGIIGGSDGPTAIFVSSNPIQYVIISIIIICMIVVGLIVLKKGSIKRK